MMLRLNRWHADVHFICTSVLKLNIYWNNELPLGQLCQCLVGEVWLGLVRFSVISLHSGPAVTPQQAHFISQAFCHWTNLELGRSSERLVMNWFVLSVGPTFCVTLRQFNFAHQTMPLHTTKQPGFSQFSSILILCPDIIKVLTPTLITLCCS